MNIDGIYLFKADSGIPLYSRKTANVEEDLFSAFLSALKGFFNSFSLGGLSTFASENYIFYLASTNNILTAIIVDSKYKSDKYFNIAFKISSEFYNHFKAMMDKSDLVMAPQKDVFDPILDEIIIHFDKVHQEQQDVLRLYKILNSGELEPFPFYNESQLYQLPIFIAVNFVTKQLFVIENQEGNVSSRLLFLANRAVSNLNQKELKSEFTIRNVSDPWDMERVVNQINSLLKGESVTF